MTILYTTALLGSLAASVSAHGYVQGIVAGGTYYQGYSPSFQYRNPPPVVVGWSDPEDLSNGYIAPDNYSNPDIICHLDATPAGTSARIAAGDVVELQWTTWPESHHGPVLDYLAKCPGDCSDVDKTALEFFKIDEGGLIDGSSSPGSWASDQLIANNNSWAVTIPKSIAPGNYVLRHEIIALHSAGQSDGAQNYPQCINLEITSDGTDSPSGTLGTALYKESDPGILIDIYTSLSTYTIPGPSLYSEAVSMSQTTVAIASDAPASTGSSTAYVAASTTAAAASTSAVVASSQSSTPVAYTSSAAALSSASSAAVESSQATSVATVSSSSSAAAAIQTSSCTTTLYQTVTAVATATVTSGGEAPAPYSVVASIVSVVPSEVLTSTISATYPSGTATPSGYGPGSAGNSTTWGDKPSKPLPAGYTLQDLLEWVAYLMKQAWREDEKSMHQRSFRD